MTVSSILKRVVVVSPEVWEGKADHITRSMGRGGGGGGGGAHKHNRINVRSLSRSESPFLCLATARKRDLNFSDLFALSLLLPDLAQLVDRLVDRVLLGSGVRQEN